LTIDDCRLMDCGLTICGGPTGVSEKRWAVVEGSSPFCFVPREVVASSNFTQAVRRGSSSVEMNGMSHFMERVPRILLVAAARRAAAAVASTPAEIPLWPNGAPGSEGKSTKEDITTSASGELRVAGIHNPTITPYLPAQGGGDGARHPRDPWWRASDAGDQPIG
jgi:hypothetical protein